MGERMQVNPGRVLTYEGSLVIAAGVAERIYIGDPPRALAWAIKENLGEGTEMLIERSPLFERRVRIEIEVLG